MSLRLLGAVLFSFAAVGCGGDDGGGESSNGCSRQCQILNDCGAVDVVNDCMTVCTEGLQGQCIPDHGCNQGEGGDVRTCVNHLLAENANATGTECNDEFQSSWCDTYYNDPACAPISLGGITCSGGGGTCTNDCPTSFDGECDDGGYGSQFSICTLGSDCADCGPR